MFKACKYPSEPIGHLDVDVQSIGRAHAGYGLHLFPMLVFRSQARVEYGQVDAVTEIATLTRTVSRPVV